MPAMDNGVEYAAPGFLDSSVVLYLLSGDSAKAVRTEQLLKTKPIISVQVLNEVTHVCRRKIAMSWSDIAQFLLLVRGFCTLVPLTEATHDQARRIAERYHYHLYDACIIASARMAACQTLFSEDMHDGQVLEQGLTIRNPYKDIPCP